MQSCELMPSDYYSTLLSLLTDNQYPRELESHYKMQNRQRKKMFLSYAVFTSQVPVPLPKILPTSQTSDDVALPTKLSKQLLSSFQIRFYSLTNTELA